MDITVKNIFHGTEVVLRVSHLPTTLTVNQVRRMRRKLCGNSDCRCNILSGGAWSEDGYRLDIYPTNDEEGNFVYRVEAR